MMTHEAENLLEADAIDDAGALAILRRGVAASPALRAGVRSTLMLALAAAAGRLVIPIAIRQIIDRGFVDGYRPAFVFTTVAFAAVAIVVIGVVNRLTYLRLVTSAQETLVDLRTRTFDHVHELSMAHHDESKRGVLVSRVTSDTVTLAQFAQWGAISWIVNSTIVVITLIVMAIYSWQLALVTVVCFIPVLPLMRFLQRRQLAAYDWQRTAVAETLGEMSEAVMGAAEIRAYGMRRPVWKRVQGAIGGQYRANMRAALFFSLMFAVSDMIGAVAVSAVIGAGVWWGPDWGLTEGTVVACVFLANLLLGPIGEIGEVLDQTQTALAGWRKILNLLDAPVDVVEPTDGRPLPDGALAVSLDSVGFEYIPGTTVLSGVSLDIPRGAKVAVVGETGSGKTTMAKLLCRLADPTEGRVRIEGVDLRDVDPVHRSSAVRLVPQDGFLFDDTIGENVAAGRAGSSEADARAAFEQLGLDTWLDSLPNGIHTEVGERGTNLSVGERQLVALARAQLADVGLLILDEATSAVDAETERALAEALDRLAQGRTTVTVAHRLSTAEHADFVVVFDAGRVAEVGGHEELIEAGGMYAALHASWLGGTREDVA